MRASQGVQGSGSTLHQHERVALGYTGLAKGGVDPCCVGIEQGSRVGVESTIGLPGESIEAEGPRVAVERAHLGAEPSSQRAPPGLPPEGHRPGMVRGVRVADSEGQIGERCGLEGRGAIRAPGQGHGLANAVHRQFGHRGWRRRRRPAHPASRPRGRPGRHRGPRTSRNRLKGAEENRRKLPFHRE